VKRSVAEGPAVAFVFAVAFALAFLSVIPEGNLLSAFALHPKSKNDVILSEAQRSRRTCGCLCFCR